MPIATPLVFLLTFLPFAVHLMCSGSLAFGAEIGSYTWPVAFGSTILMALAFKRTLHLSWQSVVALCSAFCTVIAVSHGFAGAFYDTSWDGQTYHQEAIFALSEGWNPFLTKLVGVFGDNSFPQLDAAINNFPKAFWYYAASTLLFFGSIEPGKALFWILGLAAFLFTFEFLVTTIRIKKLPAVAFTAAAVLNPIAISQALTFYLDGQVYFLLLIFLGLMVKFLLENTRQPLELSLFFIVTSLLVNTKIPAVAFAGFFIALFVTRSVTRYFIKGSERDFWQGAEIGILGVVAVFGIGLHPYTTNMFEFGNPFFSVLGDAAVIDTGSQRPKNFEGMSNLQMFAESLFSTSANPPWHPAVSSVLKLPFSLEWPGEIMVFGIPDVRTGGFGPLFSSALMLALVVLPVTTFFSRNWKACSYILGVCALIFASCVIHPEAWWARYVPHFYLIPLIVAVALHIEKVGKSPRMGSAIAAILTSILLVNGALIAFYSLSISMGKSHAVALNLSELREISGRNDSVLEVDFREFRSNRDRFRTVALPYVEISSPLVERCEELSRIPYSRAVVCNRRVIDVPQGTVACTDREGALGLFSETGPLTGAKGAGEHCVTIPVDVSARLDARQGKVSQLLFQMVDGSTRTLWIKTSRLSN